MKTKTMATYLKIRIKVVDAKTKRLIPGASVLVMMCQEGHQKMSCFYNTDVNGEITHVGYLSEAYDVILRIRKGDGPRCYKPYEETILQSRETTESVTINEQIELFVE